MSAEKKPVRARSQRHRGALRLYKNFRRNLRRRGEVKMRIFPEVDHVDLVMHLMFGGVTRDLVMDWMTDEEGVEK